MRLFRDENKAPETPFKANRADQTYLFANETKRSSKSLSVTRLALFEYTPYVQNP